MAKTKQQKIDLTAHVVKMLTTAKGAVFADFTGLTMKEMTELRKKLREQGIEYEVIKKTLLKRALTEAKLTDIASQDFAGSISVATSPLDEVVAAKVLVVFTKTHDKLQVLGGVLENAFVDPSRVKALALLPGKQELLGQVVGTIAAPMSGMLRVLAGNLRALVQVLSALSKKS